MRLKLLTPSQTQRMDVTIKTMTHHQHTRHFRNMTYVSHRANAVSDLGCVAYTMLEAKE